MDKKKKYIYKNHPEHKGTFKYEPDGYIIDGMFYKDKNAVGNLVFREQFKPIPVYFKPLLSEDEFRKNKFSEWVKNKSNDLDKAGDGYENLSETGKECIDYAIGRYISFLIKQFIN